MAPLLFLGYLALCLLVGILGRNTRIGYWGTVLVSVVVTPFLMFLMIFLLGRCARPQRSEEIDGERRRATSSRTT